MWAGITTSMSLRKANDYPKPSFPVQSSAIEMTEFSPKSVDGSIAVRSDTTTHI
jgi:hypothetical protein